MISCVSLPQKLEITSKPIEIQKVIHPRPNPVISPDLNLRVVTGATIGDDVIFGFNENDYLSLAGWLQDILRYIRQQNAVIEAYESSSSKPDKAQSKSL